MKHESLFLSYIWRQFTLNEAQKVVDLFQFQNNGHQPEGRF